jgi:hypothetical protein
MSCPCLLLVHGVALCQRNAASAVSSPAVARPHCATPLLGRRPPLLMDPRRLALDGGWPVRTTPCRPQTRLPPPPLQQIAHMCDTLVHLHGAAQSGHTNHEGVWRHCLGAPFSVLSSSGSHDFGETKAPVSGIADGPGEESAGTSACPSASLCASASRCAARAWPSAVKPSSSLTSDAAEVSRAGTSAGRGTGARELASDASSEPEPRVLATDSASSTDNSLLA